MRRTHSSIRCGIRRGVRCGIESSTGFRATWLPIALASLIAAGATSGCAPFAVIGTAIVVNDEFVDNSVSTTVGYDVDYAWPATCNTISHMADDLLEIDYDLRTIKTYVDGAEVLIQVETYAVGQTRIRVAAKRYLVFSDEVAGNVLDGIVRDLG